MIKEIFDDKSEKDISLEWDSVVERRSTEIKLGNDKSFLHILFPTILKNIRKIAKDNKICVVDCGCGSGEIAIGIEQYCEKVIGIDISYKSIEIAKKSNKSNKIHYYNTSIEKYSLNNKEIADVCIMNMVLSNVVDCNEVCCSVNSILKKNGKVFITIPHPCYWPQYWGYSKQEWFDYKKQLCMTGEFCITGIGNIGVTTHIHRPLELYIQTLIETGFNIIGFEELFSELNKGMNEFLYPRFIFIEGEKR